MPDDPKLETVDLLGVELMEAGVTVRGALSPPEGDVYDEDRLRRLAEDSNAVVNEARPFMKIGHSPEQRLARGSGLYDDQDNPATGWLQNFRVDGDKLKGDLLRVPKKLAGLVESGAFRARSVEVSPFRSQTDGSMRPKVIRGLALLGAKSPAFRTLDDIYALYAGEDDPSTAELIYADEATGPGDEVEVSDFAEGDVVWDPERGANDLMEDIRRALNPSPTGGSEPMDRYWVRDVIQSDGGGRALVEDSSAESSVAWVVPYSLDADGEPVVASTDAWTMAQQAWLQASAKEAGEAGATGSTSASTGEYADDETISGAGDDTTTRMPENKTKPEVKTETETVTAEALLQTFAEAVGADPAETDPAKLVEAAAALRAKAEAEPKEKDLPEGTRLMSEDEYSELRGMASDGAKAHEELRILKRDSLVEGAAKDGLIDPAKVEDYKRRYDAAPDLVTEIFSELTPREEYKTYGADGGGDPDAEILDGLSEEQYAEFCDLTGIPYVPGKVAKTKTEATA